MLHLPACGCILVSVFSPVNPNSLTGKHAIEPAPEKDRMGLDDKVSHEKGTVTESTVATRSGGQGLGRHERFGAHTARATFQQNAMYTNVNHILLMETLAVVFTMETFPS